MRKVISFAPFVKMTDLKSGEFSNNIFLQDKKRQLKVPIIPLKVPIIPLSLVCKDF